MTESSPYRTILVALDDDPASEQALDHARYLARAFGSTLVLLRPGQEPALPPDQIADQQAAIGPQGPVALGGAAVVPPAMPYSDPPQHISHLEETAATGSLNILANRLRDEGFLIEEAEIVEDLGDAIVSEARIRNVGLIVMVAHSQGGLGRLLFGSDTDTVLRNAPCPVLLVRAS